MNSKLRRAIIRVASTNVAFRRALARELRAFSSEQLQAKLQNLVEEANLFTVVDALAEVCYDKGGEIEDKDKSDPEAKEWESAGAQIASTARNVRRLLRIN